MELDWNSVFDNFGTKIVSKTDIEKKAYVPNKSQRMAIAAAGILPSLGGSGETFDLWLLFDDTLSKLETSYYPSLRVGSGREAEMRMGRGIASWAAIGDVIIIGNVGKKIYALKEASAHLPIADLGRELSRKIDRKRVFENAQKAAGKPARKVRTINDFVRNASVVAAAILRSNGKCEMPNCATRLFRRSDGSQFLEVHHVTPLAEGGDDALLNAAALCPMCHRELHFGVNAMKKRAILAAHVLSIPAG